LLAGAALPLNFHNPTTATGAIVAGTFWLIARKQTEEDWIRHTLEVRNQFANC